MEKSKVYAKGRKIKTERVCEDGAQRRGRKHIIFGAGEYIVSGPKYRPPYVNKKAKQTMFWIVLGLSVTNFI